MSPCEDEIPLATQPLSVERLAQRPFSRNIWSILVPLTLGLLVIAAASVREESYHRTQPLGESLLFDSEQFPLPKILDPTSDNRIPTRIRYTEPTFLANEGQVGAVLNSSPEGRIRLKQLRQQLREPVVLVSLDASGLQSLIVSGRAPEPGAYEALAGDLTLSKSTFELDDKTFTVVGRLARHVSALSKAYVVVFDRKNRELFWESDEAKGGWLVKDAIPKLRAAELTDEQSVELSKTVIASPTRMQPVSMIGCLSGLMLVTFAWTRLMLMALRRLGNLETIVHAPLLTRMVHPFAVEIVRRPRLVLGLHVLHYGVWFGFMIVAAFFPAIQITLINVLRSEFADGSLSYIGSAYASRNIIFAAAATFTQNFVVGTFVVTMLPSLFIPGWGLVKNFLSFSLLGFAMSPTWMNSPGITVLHSMTIAMELEAYTLAGVAILIWPVRVVSGFTTRSFSREYFLGVRALFSGAILIAFLLAVAALYEATTIIQFR